jgi:hypothetical protein
VLGAGSAADAVFDEYFQGGWRLQATVSEDMLDRQES